MRTEDDQPETNSADSADQPQTRRAMLQIGALAAAAVVPIRPAMAQVITSALTCSIPVPQSSQAGKWIKNNGDVVNANTANSFAPPPQPLKGEDVKNSLKFGTNYPTYNTARSTAYNNYIKKLTIGKQGYTCYASLKDVSRW